MSHTAVPFLSPSSTRGKPGPRWSVEPAAHEVAALLPASIAALPGASAIVCVGPPLLANPPANPDWVLGLSPAAVRLQVPSLARLLPCEMGGVAPAATEQSPPALPAMIVLRRLTVPDGKIELSSATPPPLPARLPAIVTLLRLTMLPNDARTAPPSGLVPPVAVLL